MSKQLKHLKLGCIYLTVSWIWVVKIDARFSKVILFLFSIICIVILMNSDYACLHVFNLPKLHDITISQNIWCLKGGKIFVLWNHPRAHLWKSFVFEENRIKFHLIKHAIAAVERYIVIGLSKIFKEKFREAEIKLKNAFNIFF